MAEVKDQHQYQYQEIGNDNDNDIIVRYEPLNVTVIMLDRRTALLQWWPENALMHRDVEIVFTPEYSK